MVTAKLLLKIYDNRERALHSAKILLDNELKELDASAQVHICEDNWLATDITGEDSEFACNFLINKYGTPVRDIKNDKIYYGFIQQIKGNEIVVDIGVHVSVPQKNLTVLGSGNSEQIAMRFGLIKNLPVRIEIKEEIEKIAAFTKEQIDTWWKWKKSGQDRVIANSVTRSELKTAVKRTGHARDIYGIERLGLMEHMIICRDGTDGPGIVSAIGKFIKGDLGVIISTS